MQSTKGLHYYQHPLSPFCHPITYLLKANNVPYEEHFVDLFKGENKTEEYKKISPRQKVPAITDDDFNLYESSTILRYLANSKAEIAEHWYPKDSKKRALVDLYLDWHSANISAFLTFGRVKLGMLTTVTLEDATAGAAKFLQEFETLFLSQGKFLASDEKVTIADIAVIFFISGMNNTGLEYSQGVKDYLKNVVEAQVGLTTVFEENDNRRTEFLRNMAAAKAQQQEAAKEAEKTA